MNLTPTFNQTLGIAMITTMTIGNAAAGTAPQLYAGTARADITPTAEQAVDLSNRPMQLHEPLYARALVLQSGDTRLAIVSLDLILFSSRKVVDEAKARFNLDHVILSSSHTHAAPAAEGMRIKPPLGDWTRRGEPGDAFDWDALSDDPWYAATEAKILAAIGEAAGDLFPAALSAGRGPFESVYLAHNRRKVHPDGRVEMMWDNPTLQPTEPLDPSLGVIRISDAEGNPRVILVHYACHPVAMMASGLVSRDYPGAMCDYVEAELGDEVMAMFLQGAAGDLDPHFMNQRGQHRLNVVRETGVALGRAALALAADLPPANPAPRITAEQITVALDRRNSAQTSDAVLTLANFDDRIALVSVPGEPFVQLQLDLRSALPHPDPWMLGLAYSGAGSPFLIYIPNENAVAQGGYGATECSYVAPEAGAKIVAAAVDALRRQMRRGTP